MIRYLSLFTGIGAFEKALKRSDIDFELVGFSEIDKYAIKSYCAIHGVDESLNLGDISKIDLEKLPKEINSREIANSITTVQKDSMVGDGVVTSDMRVRKLTPLECWRLMGFDDSDFYKAQSVPTSNTQLYKQARKLDCGKCTRSDIQEFIWR